MLRNNKLDKRLNKVAIDILRSAIEYDIFIESAMQSSNGHLDDVGTLNIKAPSGLLQLEFITKKRAANILRNVILKLDE